MCRELHGIEVVWRPRLRETISHNVGTSRTLKQQGWNANSSIAKAVRLDSVFEFDSKSPDMTREGTVGVWSVTVDAVLNGRDTHTLR